MTLIAKVLYWILWYLVWTAIFYEKDGELSTLVAFWGLLALTGLHPYSILFGSRTKNEKSLFVGSTKNILGFGANRVSKASLMVGIGTMVVLLLIASVMYRYSI